MKLDSFNKILLATGSINYMASALNGVNLQMACLPDPNGYHKDGLEERAELLKSVETKLYKAMEQLADYMNESDCISPIDVRATREAFDILSGRNDSVEAEELFPVE